MKKLLVLLLLSFFLMAGNSMAAPLEYTNNRPVDIGTSWDGASKELAVLLPMFNVYSDQQAAGYWQLGGFNPSAIPAVSFEITSNSANLQMGIFSDLNGDTDLAGRSLVDIFLGPASAGTRAGIGFDLLTGLMTISQVSGPTGAVNTGVYTGIVASGFGFYIQPTGGSETFYSLDQLNGGLAQMLAFRNTSSNLWTLAFEDIAIRNATGELQGDYDYNDFIFQIESITPVPEPATMLLLGLGLIGLAGFGRKRLLKK